MSFDSNPIDFPELWDTFSIVGTLSPGKCKFGKVKRKYQWDKKKGKGSKGESLTFTQIPSVEVSVTLEFWTAAHFREWDEFLPLLKFDPTKKTVTAIEIYHPALADLHTCSSC
jgi:hypothetical protein